ncbi:MAG TPA: LeuA family protein [Candidatus Aminicenantes bacterium]|nr:LeuA family protein [Candidatus Aminicenantes bacterium]
MLRHFKGVVDSTLREGFQFAGADFSPDDQAAIFDRLVRLGVDIVEVGNPVQPEIRQRVLALSRRRGASLRPRLFAHIRNHERDVRAAAESGVDGVSILCTADRERLAAMGLTRDSARDRLRSNIALAVSFGLESRVGVEDFFGRSFRDCLEVYDLAAAAGAARIALADTLGKAQAWDVARKVAALRKRTALGIEAHFHNDLGQAVSNAVAAVRAGANWISCSLLGIGERTGITPLSSFLANLYVLDPAAASRYRLEELTDAEGLVSRLCGIDVPLHLITSPANGFAHKAGIHLDALMKFGPGKYEPLPPRVVGNVRRLVLHTPISGKTSERQAREFEQRFG